MSKPLTILHYSQMLKKYFLLAVVSWFLSLGFSANANPPIAGCQNRNSPTQAQIDATNKAGYGYSELIEQTAVVGRDPKTGSQVDGYVDPISRQFIPYCPVDMNKLVRGVEKLKGSNSESARQCRAYQAAKQACATAADIKGCIRIRSGGIDPSLGDSAICNFY